MPLNRLLIKNPLISEKATDLGQENKYVFMVNPRANKKQVKKLIEEIYGVTVVATNIVRMNKRSNNYKKAIVTLKDGDKIDTVPH
ncbi:MAG: 50S ribosomal protein L23 [Parcubacteria group bacterium GW2011_GWB1_45_7]|uniref:Large ribosomal subunit protein uL23 n=3 Tax=Parcubacteria group TaxID=1794811 RepID=A0A0H4TP46_9BACT|nr:50S ribosomal protein L25, large subunit ribosomal protein L23 [uncultured Parcubacteria bacterium Rifle_16ft_4_minimus_37647]KKU11946.1 MAG: 50S ribosomal protein L23 [Parcubacteria group bacterium GW2011_GWB1_45_7]OGY58598.1 MAG: 50S ribosomal protein L23 [Candidatus Colwellbacteria bacterium RIFCSPHIGHO2_02_FULL_45_17]OGY61693.1 MAG: 50S ribosomal protein L23 [Candidatus Colwellbacteria bacterium RIFCSPLOWO2_02_FULL_45_11]OGY62735.1 MAG: 50S ribosomal protein L23 [Candidatus Colwellbacter